MYLVTRLAGLSLTAALVVASGCYTGPEGDFERDGEIVTRGATLNGVTLNGAYENGVILNGFVLNGFVLNGFVLNGFVLNGFVLNGFVLNGSELVVTGDLDGDEIEIAGDDLEGLTLMMQGETLIDGEYVLENVAVRIDEVYQSPDEEDLNFHLISSLNPVTQEWSPLCTDSFGEPTEAILLSGAWDGETGDHIEDDEIATFACRGGVLAKCVELGYAPWREGKIKTSKKKKSTVTLADHHQACTRMLRADYCGIGEPNTLNGTLIDVGDKVKPKKIQKYETKWDYEAEWGPDGATCISDSLRTQLFEGQDGYEMPACIEDIPHKKKCGKLKKTWKTGALLGTRFELEAQIG